MGGSGEDKQILRRLKLQRDQSAHHFWHEADALHKHIRGKAARQSFEFDRTVCPQRLRERCVPICNVLMNIAFPACIAAALLKSTLFSLVIKFVRQKSLDGWIHRGPLLLAALISCRLEYKDVRLVG